MLTSKIMDKWRNLLENDPNATRHGQWVGFYCDGEEDSTFLLQCAKDFILSRRIQYHLSLPLTITCFVVGTHSRCFNKWWCPTMNFSCFFHHVKIITPTWGPTIDGNKAEITFFYGKEAMIRWDLDMCQWVRRLPFP